MVLGGASEVLVRCVMAAGRTSPDIELVGVGGGVRGSRHSSAGRNVGDAACMGEVSCVRGWKYSSGGGVNNWFREYGVKGSIVDLIFLSLVQPLATWLAKADSGVLG